MPVTSLPNFVKRKVPCSTSTSRMIIVHRSATHPMRSCTSASTLGSSSGYLRAACCANIVRSFAICCFVGGPKRGMFLIYTLLLVSITHLGAFFPRGSEYPMLETWNHYGHD